MSNRSLAAARSRRSPQEVVNEQAFKKQPPQMPPQNMQSKGPNSSPPPTTSSTSQEHNGIPQPGSKLSIGDAIGLITIRLSKIESHIMKEQAEEKSSTQQQQSNASSSSDVDTIMRSLVSRVTLIERVNEATNKNIEKINTNIKNLAEKPVEVKDIGPSSPDPFLIELIEKNEKEISELKQLVIRLQTMFIETTMTLQQIQQQQKQQQQQQQQQQPKVVPTVDDSSESDEPIENGVMRLSI